MLPKVREGIEDCSQLENILNDFKQEAGYTDKIKEFNEKSYKDWCIKDYLRLINLGVLGLDTDLRSLFYDYPNSKKIIFFFSDKSKIQNETDWIESYDFFLRLVQNKKENEIFFCCNIQLNTNIRNIHDTCVIEYDFANNEHVLFQKGEVIIPQEIKQELDEFEIQKDKFNQFKDNTRALSLFLSKNKIEQMETKSKEIEYAEKKFKSIEILYKLFFFFILIHFNLNLKQN